nr:ribonuclease H-like domain-containing protein [Tanacetum cinerariifolium]
MGDEGIAKVYLGCSEVGTNKPSKDMSKILRSDAPIIKYWISDSEDKTENESVPKQKEPSFVPTSEHVKTLRESVKKVKHPKHAKNFRTNNQKFRGHKKNWNKKAYFVCRSLNQLIKVCDYYEKQMGNPQQPLKDKGNPKGGKISGKGKIKTRKFDFDDVYFVKKLKFNLFSVSQMCDKKNSVLFTNTECVVLSSDYKLPDENHVLLRVPRENNMYNVDLKNIVPSGDLTCLFAKATLDEYNLWHKRLGHINFKIMNKLVKGNLVRDPLGKFDGKADEGYLVGYSVNSKAFRVFNSRTRIVQETLHINFLENKPNVTRIRPKWLFDIDTLTKSMNYQPVVVGNQPNDNVDPQNTYADVADAAFDVKENENDAYVSPSGSDMADNKKHDDKAKRNDKGNSHGHTQEEGIDYDEFFAPVARIESIRLFLAYDSFMGFLVYQMDVKSAFLYGTIKEEVYVCQPLGVEDLDYPDKVYKVVKALYGLHQALRTCKELASPKQTALGKDITNSFMAGSLPKTIWSLVNAVEGFTIMVNPTIYVSCIKQFWAMATIKKVNNVVQLRALINGKKVVVTEDVIRRDLHLDDADGVECLPNEEIFAELARIGRKFNFSKYIFDSMVRNVDSPSKFLMYTSPALTQKVFANMQRVGKGLSGVKAHLFASMLVQPLPKAKEEEVEDEMRIAPLPPLQDPTHTPHATPQQDQPSTPPVLPS